MSVDETIKASFGFLVQEQGFEIKQSHSGQRESSVTFCSPLARVIVHVDHLPLGVCVGVGLFEARGERVMVDEYGLVLLVRDLAPEDAARLQVVDSLDDALATHAALLERHAADLVRGDGARVPRLRRLRAEETRRDHKARFGTSTGETPRFAGRPTLDALFADATNEGMKTPRAYQAFRDYDYTLAEIARYLELTEQDVQATLDDWDRL